jgi:hypothetical protein
MATGIETNWECASCSMPVKFNRMKYSYNDGPSFPVMVIERVCDCKDGRIMNRRKGRFLSPEEV